MSGSADALRRWFGLLFLALAAGMLIWGQTLLKPHLQGWLFLVYWSACFLFTGAAVWTALLDLRATRQRTRAEQRRLLERALHEIDARQRDKPKPDLR